MTEPNEGNRAAQSKSRDELQAQMKEHLDSLEVSKIGDLDDQAVEKLQLRLDVLERWARLNDSVMAGMYDDDDTNLHHHHHILDVPVLPRIDRELPPDTPTR